MDEHLNELSQSNSISNPSRNKTMLFAGYGFIGLFALLILSKTLVPQGSNELSDTPIFDYIVFFGFGVCVSIMGIGYSYFAWTKSSKDYVEWFLAQSTRKMKWQVELMSDHPVYAVWLARLIAPVIALFGIAMMMIILYSTLLLVLG